MNPISLNMNCIRLIYRRKGKADVLNNDLMVLNSESYAKLLIL